MNRTTWINAGKPDPYDLAKEKVKDILVNHQPTPLSDSVAGDLRRFVTEVEKENGELNRQIPTLIRQAW